MLKDGSSENGTFDNNNDLENSYTSRRNEHENQVDKTVENEKNSIESSQPSLNLLTMIMSKFEVREKEEAIEDDCCPICMEEYGKICYFYAFNNG